MTADETAPDCAATDSGEGLVGRGGGGGAGWGCDWGKGAKDPDGGLGAGRRGGASRGEHRRVAPDSELVLTRAPFGSKARIPVVHMENSY